MFSLPPARLDGRRLQTSDAISQLTYWNLSNSSNNNNNGYNDSDRTTTTAAGAESHAAFACRPLLVDGPALEYMPHTRTFLSTGPPSRSSDWNHRDRARRRMGKSRVAHYLTTSPEPTADASIATAAIAHQRATSTNVDDETDGRSSGDGRGDWGHVLLAPPFACIPARELKKKEKKRKTGGREGGRAVVVYSFWARAVSMCGG